MSPRTIAPSWPRGSWPETNSRLPPRRTLVSGGPLGSRFSVVMSFRSVLSIDQRCDAFRRAHGEGPAQHPVADVEQQFGSGAQDDGHRGRRHRPKPRPFALQGFVGGRTGERLARQPEERLKWLVLRGRIPGPQFGEDRDSHPPGQRAEHDLAGSIGNADPRRPLARRGGERIALHRPDRHADASLAQEVRRRHAEADGEPVARDRRTGSIGYADSPALAPQPVGVKSGIGLDSIVPDEEVEKPGCETKRVRSEEPPVGKKWD